MHFSKQMDDTIADFRGLPRTTTESSKRSPVSIETVLEFLKEKYTFEQTGAERVIVEKWNEIFGNLAGRCNPVSLKNGNQLIISVSNQTLRSELQFRKRAIIKKIQALPHCDGIIELIVKA